MCSTVLSFGDRILLPCKFWYNTYNLASKTCAMFPDPLTLCLFVINSLKIGGNLGAAQGEVNAYMNTLAIALNIFHSVETIRQATWFPRAIGARIDSELQQIRRGLHDAKRDVIRIADDARATDPHLGASGTLAWTLKNKAVAQANEPLLLLCIDRLREIRQEMEQASASRPQAADYFEAIETEMWNALSKRAARQATLYEGKGERLRGRLGLEECRVVAGPTPGGIFDIECVGEDTSMELHIVKGKIDILSY